MGDPDRQTDGWTDRQTATPAGCLLLADGVYAIYAIAVVASFGVPLSSHPNDLHYISTKPSLFAKQTASDGKKHPPLSTTNRIIIHEPIVIFCCCFALFVFANSFCIVFVLELLLLLSLLDF